MYGQAHGFSPIERYELFHKKNTESGKSVPDNFDPPVTTTLTSIVPYQELLDFKSTIKSSVNDDGEIDILNIRFNRSKRKSNIYI